MTVPKGDDEREFLHDLASPLATALLLLDSYLDDIQSRPDANPEDIVQLKQAHEAMECVRTKLKQRRESLIKQGKPSART